MPRSRRQGAPALRTSVLLHVIVLLSLDVFSPLPCLKCSFSIKNHRLLITVFMLDSVFLPSLQQSATTERRNERANLDLKPFSLISKTSRLQETPSRFFTSFFLNAGYSLPTPTPSAQSHYVPFFCPALGPGRLTPLESITAALLPSGSLWVQTKRGTG